MKIGFISDLHLEFRQDFELEYLTNTINNTDVDIIIDAGDLHPSLAARLQFIRQIRHPYHHVMGNHDFYHSTLSSCKWLIEQNGIKVVGCTLWTDFDHGNPLVMAAYKKTLADGRCIKPSGSKSLDQEVYEIHLDHLKFIQEHNPDILVAHHGTSFESMHPMFANSGYINNYFYSNLDAELLALSNLKYIVHGHTHCQMRYKLGDRIDTIVHPLGYPHERSIVGYNPVVIDYLK